MTNLFVYGTLIHPHILSRVLAGTLTRPSHHDPSTRRFSHLTVVPAILAGYQLSRVKGQEYPALTLSSATTQPSQTQAVVRGVVVHGLSPAELAALDLFEGDEYARRSVQAIIPSDDRPVPNDTRSSWHSETIQDILDSTLPPEKVQGLLDGTEPSEIRQVQTYIWVADASELEGTDGPRGPWSFSTFAKSRASRWTSGEWTDAGGPDGIDDDGTTPSSHHPPPFSSTSRSTGDELPLDPPRPTEQTSNTRTSITETTTMTDGAPENCSGTPQGSASTNPKHPPTSTPQRTSARGRHRRQPPGPKVAANSQVTGKRNTQAKNERYARPLPLSVAAAAAASKPSSHLSWSQWLISCMRFRSPAKPQDEVLIGYLDELTTAVWVQVTPPGASSSGIGPSSQTKTARVLWDAGFFGKGSLSRSEPTWRTRKINEEKIKKQRERGMKVFTPEELTALRRRERMHAKIERARLAVKAGQQLPDGIVALGGVLTAEEEKLLRRRVEKEIEQEDDQAVDQVEEEYGKHIPGLIYLGPKKNDGGEQKQLSKEEMERIEQEEANVEVEDVEWLHLSGAEVFFLSGMLGVLEVRDEQDKQIPLQSLYDIFLSSHLPSPMRSLPAPENIFRPDNPFLLSYIAFHHYRSLGWAVKSGLKFCCDWLLYKRGPVFGHAEFAVVVIPVYEDESDEASSPFPKHPASGDRDWVWFSTMNRVQTQVLKTLVLAHITIPALSRVPEELLRTPQGLVQGLRSGQLHSIKEVSLRRWVPARMRS